MKNKKLITAVLSCLLLSCIVGISAFADNTDLTNTTETMPVTETNEVDNTPAFELTVTDFTDLDDTRSNDEPEIITDNPQENPDDTVITEEKNTDPSDDGQAEIIDIQKNNKTEETQNSNDAGNKGARSESETAENCTPQVDTQTPSYTVTVSDGVNSVDLTGGSLNNIRDILISLGYDLTDAAISVDETSVDTDVLSLVQDNGEYVLGDNGPFSKAKQNLIIFINGEPVELTITDPVDVSGDMSAAELAYCFSTSEDGNVRLVNNVNITDEAETAITISSGIHNLYLNGGYRLNLGVCYFKISGGSTVLNIYGGEDESATSSQGSLKGAGNRLFLVESGTLKLNFLTGDVEGDGKTVISNYGNVIITSCGFVTTGSSSNTITNENTGNMTLNSCDIYDVMLLSECAAGILNKGTLNVHTGRITGVNGIINSAGATATISDSHPYSPGEVQYTVSSTNSTGFCFKNSGTLNISNGYFDTSSCAGLISNDGGTACVTGGYYSAIPSYIADGYYAEEFSDTSWISCPFNYVVKKSSGGGGGEGGGGGGGGSSPEAETKTEETESVSELSKDLNVQSGEKEALKELGQEHPEIEKNVVNVANNTANNLKKKLDNGELTQEQYNKDIKSVQDFVTVSSQLGTTMVEAEKIAEEIQETLPENTDIDVKEAITEFCEKQFELLLEENNGVLDIEEFEKYKSVILEAAQTYIEQMVNSTLMLRNCSTEAITAHIGQVLQLLTEKTYKDFNRAEADEEFANNVYSAILLNLQNQVRISIQAEYEKSRRSGMYSGTALSSLDEKYKTSLAGIEDIETFEIMVTEVMRQKFISILDGRLADKEITEQEYKELIAYAVDTDTFTPVYKSIFRSWALKENNEYGITLEELTNAAIAAATGSLEPATYKNELTSEDIVTLVLAASAAVTIGIAYAVSSRLRIRRRRCKS